MKKEILQGNLPPIRPPNTCTEKIVHGRKATKKPPKTCDFRRFLTQIGCLGVGLPGFEPGMTGPESVVLPLHHSPIIGSFRFAVAKIQRF